MSLMILGHYAFNLFFNSAFSFMAGLFVVWAILKTFRVQQNRWMLFLLTLPFLKIIWDLCFRGIPSHSILYSGVDPLSFQPKSQMFTVGLGSSQYGPIVNVLFTTTDPQGKQYSLSAADYFFSLASKHISHAAPYILLGLALGTSFLLVARRVVSMIRFERQRRAYRKSDSLLQRLRCGRREIDVYISRHYEGTPFTGGILHPYICIPEKTRALLSEEQLRAVIFHELGHVKQWDLLGTLFIKNMGDIFWFVPFYRALSRKIDRLREILADEYALCAGAAPEFLASALLSLENTHANESEAVIYSAFFREKALLKVRVEKLLGHLKEKSPRFGWNKIWVRIPVTAWTTGGVMLATFGGNHNVVVNRGLPPEMLAFIHFVKMLLLR